MTKAMKAATHRLKMRKIKYKTVLETMRQFIMLKNCKYLLHTGQIKPVSLTRREERLYFFRWIQLSVSFDIYSNLPRKTIINWITRYYYEKVSR